MRLIDITFKGNTVILASSIVAKAVNLSTITSQVFWYIINFVATNEHFPSLFDAQNYLQYSEKELKQAIHELESKNLVSRESEPKTKIALQTSNITKEIEKVQKEASQKSRESKNRIKLVAKEVNQYYLNQLKAFGSPAASNRDFSLRSFAQLKKFISDYQQLNAQDFKNIIDLGMKNGWILQKKAYTSINALMSVALENYIQNKRETILEKSKRIPIINNKGSELDETEWGYFLKKNDGSYVFVPPENEESFYHQVLKIHEEFDESYILTNITIHMDDIIPRLGIVVGSICDDYGVLPEYGWMIGKTGIDGDNRFVKE